MNDIAIIIPLYNEIKVLLEEYGFENYEFLNVDI